MLRLTFSSTAPWVNATLAPPRPCLRREGLCIPVSINFLNTSLAAGQYTASITVSDPAATDAPQNILVLLSVGTTIPDRVNLYVAPNGSEDSYRFHTNNPVGLDASTVSGGGWLSATFRGLGSFDFVRPYEIRAVHPSGLAEGTYQGAVPVTGSRLAADNKSVAVTLNVTRSPIAAPPANVVRLRVHQGSGKVTQSIRVSNRGMGMLALSGAPVTTASGGDWLAAEIQPDTTIIKVTADSANVAPGVYKGSIAIESNAANSPYALTVDLEVVAQRAPQIRFSSVQDGATLTEGDTLAQGGAVTVFGEGFTYQDAQPAGGAPLPNELGGTTVFVNDLPAPIYYTSFGRVNFQIPYDAPPGEAVVRVDRDGQRGGNSSIIIRPAVAKILRLRLREGGLNIPEFRDYYGVAVHADGSLSLPVEFNVPNSRPTKRGEAITVYGMGFGATGPPAVAGAAASDPPQAVDSGLARVCFGCITPLGGVRVDAQSATLAPSFAGSFPIDSLFAGISAGFPGLYQVKVVVPEDSPSGDVAVRALFDSHSSEYGYIAVE